jgi:hypothetical protein
MKIRLTQAIDHLHQWEETKDGRIGFFADPEERVVHSHALKLPAGYVLEKSKIEAHGLRMVGKLFADLKAKGLAVEE